MQPLGNLLGVKDGLPQHAPLPQAVHGIVVGVGILVALQGGLIVVIQESIVLIGALETHCSGVLPIEEPQFQPVQHGHGVEGEHDLLVRPFTTQAHIQLIEVLFLDFGSLLHPDICKLAFGEGDGL